MSVYVLSMVFKAKMTPSEKVLMLALADYADDEGGSIFPSQATMAEKSSLGERTVTRLLAMFRDRGLLTEEEPATQHHPARYRMNLDMVKKLRVAKAATLLGSPTSAFRVANGDIQGSHGGYQSVSKKHPSVKASASAAQPPENQKAIARYCELWKEKYGSAPMIRGKEAGQIAAIVKHYGLDKTRQIIEAYFVTPDKFARERGHSVPILVTLLPQLVAEMAPMVEHPDTWGGKW